MFGLFRHIHVVESLPNFLQVTSIGFLQWEGVNLHLKKQPKKSKSESIIRGGARLVLNFFFVDINFKTW